VPNSSRLVSAGSNAALVWDLERLQLRSRTSMPTPTPSAGTDPVFGPGLDAIVAQPAVEVEPLAWATSPNGRLTASANSAGTITVMNLDSDKPPVLLESPGVTALDLSPIGTLASASRDGTVQIWDLASGQATKLPNGSGMAIAVLAFNPTGNRLAAGGQDGTVTIWDIPRRQIARAPLKAHGGAVRSLSFSQDGALFASGGTDRKVLVWDVASGQQIGAPLTGHTQVIQSLTFDEAGRLISRDGEVEISRRLDLTPWDVVERRACEIAHRNLSEAEIDDFGIRNLWTDLGMDGLWSIVAGGDHGRLTCREYPVAGAPRR
jgi:WD40 repeat protein